MAKEKMFVRLNDDGSWEAGPNEDSLKPVPASTIDRYEKANKYTFSIQYGEGGKVWEGSKAEVGKQIRGALLRQRGTEEGGQLPGPSYTPEEWVTAFPGGQALLMLEDIDKALEVSGLQPLEQEALRASLVKDAEGILNEQYWIDASERLKVEGIEMTPEQLQASVGEGANLLLQGDGEGEEAPSALDDFLREFSGGDGGGVSDIGPNQMAIQREKMATDILIEKMQEEHLSKTGERSMVVDLLGDMLNRNIAKHTQARDQVDRLLQSVGIMPPAGMKYNPGNQPGGPRDYMRGIYDGAEPAFPREMQTTTIPLSTMDPNVTPQDNAITTAIERARRASEAVGLAPAAGMKEGGTVRANTRKLLGFQGGFGGQLSADDARELMGLPTGGVDPYSDYSDPYATSDPEVMTGRDLGLDEWLMEQIAAEAALSQERIEQDWARISGYMPSGAPTAAMQQLENDYKAAVQAASIAASGTVQAAQAHAAATEAAAALHAEASKYAADQGLKGDEVAAAADRYVADVQAKTSAERLAFDKASHQAQLAANPRTLFESVFLNRALKPAGSVSALQSQITPPGTFDMPAAGSAFASPPTTPQAAAPQQAGNLLMGRKMEAGGRIYEGPVIARVGERDEKDKQYEKDEYALLPPGSVIAKRRKGEKPSLRNAMSALLEEAGGKPAQAQGGLAVPDWKGYFQKAGKGQLQGAQYGGTVGRLGQVTGGYSSPYRAGQAAGRTPYNPRGQTFGYRQQATPGAGASFSFDPSGKFNLGASLQQKEAERKALATAKEEMPAWFSQWLEERGGVAPTESGGGAAPTGGGGTAAAGNPLVPDIGEDVLPAELLEAPAFGGDITSSLVQPMAIRGAFGQSAAQMSQRFNPLATSVFDLGRLSPEETGARQSALSLLGIDPETYMRMSKLATQGAYGRSLGSLGGQPGRATAGRLLS